MMPTNKPASCNSCSSSHFWLCLLTSCLLKALGKAYLILMRAPTENLLSWAHITKMISMRIQWWAGHKLSPRALGCASWILDCSQLQTPRFTVVLGSHLSFECWFKKKKSMKHALFDHTVKCSKNFVPWTVLPTGSRGDREPWKSSAPPMNLNSKRKVGADYTER